MVGDHVCDNLCAKANSQSMLSFGHTIRTPYPDLWSEKQKRQNRLLRRRRVCAGKKGEEDGSLIAVASDYWLGFALPTRTQGSSDSHGLTIKDIGNEAKRRGKVFQATLRAVECYVLWW